MLTSFELKMVLRSRNRGVFPMTQTRRTTNRTFDPRDQFIYLRSALGTVVTGIFLMAAGNATAMPQVMGGFDQSPETIVQKVACLSIGPVTLAGMEVEACPRCVRSSPNSRHHSAR